MTRHEPVSAWIIDDTGYPKQGKHSVGVARQYCGQLGKQDNCQVAVSLSAASPIASLPIAYRLYLPKDWAADAMRLKCGALVTGDRTHFGAGYGKSFGGVTIHTPRALAEALLY